MAAAAAAKNAVFFEVRDAPYTMAEKLVVQSSLAELSSCYQPFNQTMLFFAAARAFGQDAQALALCSLLLESGGINLNHADVHGQTALFYAVREGHIETVKYLITKGCDPNWVDNEGNTARFFANRQNKLDVLNALDQNLQAKKRPRSEEDGSRKRQRLDDDADTHVKKLRAWANEWPVEGRVKGNTFSYKDQDVIIKTKDFVVVRKAPWFAAARLRVSEKDFVVDHAELLAHHPWFKELSHQDWCRCLGVIKDQDGAAAVTAIKDMLAGRYSRQFTLPLVEIKTRRIAGYVHAAHKEDTNELRICHLKVDTAFRGQGLGGLLIEAAEDVSRRMRWNCWSTSLSVLELNVPACQCYAKAGFKVQSSTAAYWGRLEHSASQWLYMSKVPKKSQSSSNPRYINTTNPP